MYEVVYHFKKKLFVWFIDFNGKKRAYQGVCGKVHKPRPIINLKYSVRKLT